MANTQTAVPLFVANAILTASQQNLSAGTGVPVFATTVTRDAAFGGSNKALAEGQLAYIEASNVVQYYDGTAWATLGPSSSVTSTGASTLTEQSTASTSYVDLSTVTSVTVTTGTTATLWWSGYQGNTGANVQVYVTYAVSGASTIAAADGNATFYQTPSSNLGMYIPFSAVRFITGLTAGSNTFTLKYRVSSGTGQFGQRSMAVIA